MTKTDETRPLVELLPCPFCGGVVDFGTRPNERAWWSLHCGQCTAYQVGKTKVEAIAAWNQRQPAATDAARDEVVEQIEAFLPLVHLSISDGQYHFAAKRIAAALRSPPAGDDPDLTTAYLAGKYDGRKEAAGDAAKPHAADVVERAKVAALVAATRHGVSADILEHLTTGGSHIPRNAIDAMIRAAISALTPAPPATESDATVRLREAPTYNGISLDELARSESYHPGDDA